MINQPPIPAAAEVGSGYTSPLPTNRQVLDGVPRHKRRWNPRAVGAWFAGWLTPKSTGSPARWLRTHL